LNFGDSRFTFLSKASKLLKYKRTIMNFESVPVWTMGQKFSKHKGMDVPGPGNYNSKTNKKMNPSFSFGKSARADIVPKGGPEIGPGNYNYNSSSFGSYGCAPAKAKVRGFLE
jgi:hypothetical protein